MSEDDKKVLSVLSISDLISELKKVEKSISEKEAELKNEFLKLEEEKLKNKASGNVAQLKKDHDCFDHCADLQRDLIEYFNRTHTNREIGRMYERFIGYWFEVDGWDVRFHGIKFGKEDEGCDLICTYENLMAIVQCKCWSQSKVINEKYIFQLYGASKFFQAMPENKDKKIIPMFISTTSINNIADAFSKEHGVKCLRIRFDKNYPCIKCNIGSSGDKIYHLPFDQQYDKIKIEPEKGEFYAKTIAEAEENGFRRAFRWRKAS